MSTRAIKGFDGLAAAFTKMLAEERVVVEETMAGVSFIVKHHVKKNFGDRERLAELTPYTQNERTEMGYSPDEPLLRDGSLLRDHVESEHLGPVARVGSSEPVQAYSELGFVNARTGRSVPPRPVFRLAIGDSKEDVLTVITDAVGFMLIGRLPLRLHTDDDA